MPVRPRQIFLNQGETLIPTRIGEDAPGILECTPVLDQRQVGWATIKRPMLLARYSHHSPQLRRRPGCLALKALTMHRLRRFSRAVSPVPCKSTLPHGPLPTTLQWSIRPVEATRNAKASRGRLICRETLATLRLLAQDHRSNSGRSTLAVLDTIAPLDRPQHMATLVSSASLYILLSQSKYRQSIPHGHRKSSL
jgi:hypothetical protein